MIKLFTEFTKWIATKVIGRPHYVGYTDYWFQTVNALIAAEGALTTVKRLKAVRLHVTRYLCHQPLLEAAFPIGLNRLGLPKKLGPLQNLVRGDVWDTRFLLTLLSVSRLIPCRGKVDLSTVTDGGQPTSDAVIDEFLEALKAKRWNIDVETLTWEKPHLSTKAGPNGQAMMGAIHDAHNLTSAMIDDLMVLGGPNLVDRINSIRDGLSSEVWAKATGWVNKNSLRRLSSISAPEGKERVVAIGDYWSQGALLNLHNAEFGLLKTVKADCTFNQLSPFESLPNTGPYWSLDLTAATDRVPADLQKSIITALTSSEEYGAAWYRIMTQHAFSTPWTDKPVMYGVGQPMGLYSSWATFTITHHLVVAVASTRAGLGPFWNKYCLLGDDIVLTDERVVKEYLNLMAELGVGISEAKSHMSQDMFEFAKRWYQGGVEVSGIQLSQFQGITSKDWAQLAEALRTSLSRWTIQVHETDFRVLRSAIDIFGIQQRNLDSIVCYLNLPHKGDAPEVRDAKWHFYVQRFFPYAFGCFPRYSLRETWMLQTMGTTKAKGIQEGIINAFKMIQGFLQNLGRQEWVSGLPDQGILLKLPVVEAIRSGAIDLQVKLADFHASHDNVYDDLFDGDNTLMSVVDPTRIFTSRNLTMVVQTKAKFITNFKIFVSELQMVRAGHLRGDVQTQDHSDDQGEA